MIHILDKQTDLIVDILDNDLQERVYFDDRHIDNMNQAETFDFTARADVEAARYLSGQNRVVIPGDKPGQYREFIIFNTYKNSSGNIEVKANGSYIEIQKDSPLTAFNQGPVNPEAAIQFGLNETEWKPGRVEYAAVQEISSEEAMDRWSYLLMIAEQFGMILNFRVEIVGNAIVGRYVDFLHTVGNNTGKEIVYEKDLVNITRHESTEDVITALIVEGPAEENGARISINVMNEEARQRWGRNGRHRWGYLEVEQIGNEVLTEAIVRQRGEVHLNKMLNSTIQYEVDAVSLETVYDMTHEKASKGDEIRVKDTSFVPPLYLDAKIVQVERSLSDPKEKKYTLGEFIEYTEDEVMATFRKLRNELAKKIGRTDMLDEIAAREIIRSDTAPRFPSMDMLWLDTSLYPNVLKRWDGQKWVNASPTVPGDIGAVPPAYVDMKQEIMRLRIELGSISNTKADILTEVTTLNANEYLKADAAALNALNAAANEFTTRSDNLTIQIQNTVADETLTQSEEVEINNRRNIYRNALNALIKQIRLAEDAIVKASANEVISFGDRKIFKGGTMPAAGETQNLDLWVDSSVTPPIWKQYTGGSWKTLTRTNISDMQGTISKTQIGPDTIETTHLAANAVTAKQIAANVITSNMIATAGLDAGVLTFGTATGINVDVGQAGLSAVGTVSTNVRIWAGATFANRNTAPFRVNQAGKMFASNVEIEGGSFLSTSGPLVSILRDGELQLQTRNTFTQQIITRSSLNDDRLSFGGSFEYGRFGIERGTGGIGYFDFKLPADTRVEGNMAVIGNMDFKYGTAIGDNFLQVQRTSATQTLLKTPSRLRLQPNSGIFEFFNSSGGDSMLQAYVNSSASTILKWTSTGLQVRTATDGALASIQASAFSTTSLEELKEDIQPLESAISKIRNSPVYNYLRKDTEAGKERTREIGLLHHEAPKEIIDSNSTINLYSMEGFQWRGMQEMADALEEIAEALAPLMKKKKFGPAVQKLLNSRN